MLCGEAASCIGDVGAPVTEMGTDKLIGIMSWTTGDCGDNPDVYTQVSYQLDFINYFLNP